MEDRDVYLFYALLALVAAGLVLAALLYGPLDGITTYF